MTERVPLRHVLRPQFRLGFSMVSKRSLLLCVARARLSTTSPTFSTSQPGLRTDKQESGNRDVAFYELWAKRRVYFYQVDLRGRLFLDTPGLLRRNDATCLKAEPFLDFFFQHVKRCPPKEGIPNQKPVSWREPLELFSDEYPFMSPCGRELNLLKADDTPIVFRDLVAEDVATKEAGPQPPTDGFLLYAGTLREPFNPANLLINQETQRIYYLRADGEPCLIHAHLAERLSKTFAPDGSEWEYKGKRYPVQLIKS